MRIGIIGAMQEEINEIRIQLDDPVYTQTGQLEFFNGKIKGIETVLGMSGIGKVNAAVATTLMIHNYKPDMILNIGTAAGFSPDLNIGDIVVSTEVRYHDVDVTAYNYEFGQVPRMPAYYEPAPELISIVQKVMEQEKGLHMGLISSGDAFMNDDNRVEQIKQQFPHLIAAEMEAAGVAQACYQMQTPFLIIRSISDLAGFDAKENHDLHLDYASKSAADFTLQMMEEIIYETQK